MEGVLQRLGLLGARRGRNRPHPDCVHAHHQHPGVHVQSVALLLERKQRRIVLAVFWTVGERFGVGKTSGRVDKEGWDQDRHHAENNHHDRYEKTPLYSSRHSEITPSTVCSQTRRHSLQVCREPAPSWSSRGSWAATERGS